MVCTEFVFAEQPAPPCRQHVLQRKKLSWNVLCAKEPVWIVNPGQEVVIGSVSVTVANEIPTFTNWLAGENWSRTL
jgi:hypothetical protein